MLRLSARAWNLNCLLKALFEWHLFLFCLRPFPVSVSQGHPSVYRGEHLVESWGKWQISRSLMVMR